VSAASFDYKLHFALSEIFGSAFTSVDLGSAGVTPLSAEKQNWREPVGRRRYFLTKVVWLAIHCHLLFW
jgi:hypothetical protein